jgi:hypothetical protein
MPEHQLAIVVLNVLVQPQARTAGRLLGGGYATTCAANKPQQRLLQLDYDRFRPYQLQR